MSRTWLLSTAGVFLLVLSAAADNEADKLRPLFLFNGDSLSGWRARDSKEKTSWSIATATWDEKNPGKLGSEPPEARFGADLISFKQACDIYTEASLGSGTLEVQFMIPKGSKSGVYPMGKYGIQIADSYGKPEKDLNKEDMGAICGVAPPKKNAAAKPGQWQSLVISFQAPRFENGAKKSNFKLLQVTLNGEVIHENVEVKAPTPNALPGEEQPTGPVLVKGDQGPVAFRTIKFKRAAK